MNISDHTIFNTFRRTSIDAKYPTATRQMRQIADRQQQQIDRLEGELKKLAQVCEAIITFFSHGPIKIPVGAKLLEP